MGSAHETEKIVRLGLPRIIRLKENAPELDYSSFYVTTGTGNSIDRFAVSSWMPFNYNPDGSLDLYIQNENPGADKEANWLPAPKALFNLTMRLYAPKEEILVGKWNPPPVTVIQALAALSTQ